MTHPSEDRRITVSRALGRQASLGPLPASLVLPFILSAGTAYLIGYGLLNLSLLHSSLLGVWLFASWWIVTGGYSWRFLRKFGPWFKPHWVRGSLPYRSFIPRYENRKTPKNRTR